MIDYVHLSPTTVNATSESSEVISTKKTFRLREKLIALFFNFGNSVYRIRVNTTSRLRWFFSLKKIGTFLFGTIVLVAITLGVRAALSRQAVRGDELGAVSPDVVTTPIDRSFNFQVYDKNKEPAEVITYTLTNAQLTRQIIIKAQRATAVKGRIFLIINLKLVNDTDKSLFLNTRNYIRVQPAGVDDRLAPEIHNDTVEVQPLSTKLTRVGLPVDEEVRQFKLFVGELDGEKEVIDIIF